MPPTYCSTFPPKRHGRAAMFVRYLCFAVLVAAPGCGGGGGRGSGDPVPPPGAGPAKYQLVVSEQQGFRDIGGTGVDLAVGGGPRQIAVLAPGETGPVEVTTQATLRVEDETVAVLEGAQLSAAAVGTTRLVATVGGTTLSAELRAQSLGALPIEDFDFEFADELVLHDTAPRPLPCVGRLSSGDFAAVGVRCSWRILDPTVASVDAAGTVQALADGSTFVIAREAATGRERSRRLVVALPRPSGSVLDVRGGRIEAGNAAVWVPPFALGAPVAVEVEPLAAAALPAPLPPGSDLLAAVQVGLGQPMQFAQAAAVSVATATDTIGELARCQVWNPVQMQWQHFAWVTVGALGAIEWVTWFPSIFAVTAAPGMAAMLAQQHAPAFVLANTDIGPIGMDFLLAHCDLRRSSLLTDPLVSSSPTAAELLGSYDTADHYLVLKDAESDDLGIGSDWGNAVVGGMRRIGEWQPTVYWSVRTEQRRGTPPLPFTQHYITVQYWLLYSGSSLPLEATLGFYKSWHDGDVEFCQVILDGQKEQPEPIAATASQHFYGEARAWPDVEKSGGRALFYVAKGSHATHFERGFGGGNRHRTTSGNQGFVRKAIVDPADLMMTADRCAEAGEQVLLAASNYTLVDLDDGTESTRVLRDWVGTIDRGAPDRQVGMVRYRNPKAPALGMYAHGLDFHFAYPFATATAIEAFAEVAPAGLSDWLRIGRRMVDLQQQTVATWPGEQVQSRIDAACAPQPGHLIDYLKSAAGYPPNKYYACDEWRLLAVTPAGPLSAAVGTPLQLTVSWAGLQNSTQSAIAYPLRVIVLPAVDEGFPASVFGTYVGPAGLRSFSVGPDGLNITTAPAGTTSVQVQLVWRYKEGGVEVPIPPEACASANATTQWRFHLFVRDAANTTLYHTNSLIVGPYQFERDGPPIDVTLRLCP